MEVLLWILIGICFVASLAGIILPVIPSVALVWVGMGIFHFFIDQQAIGWFTWVIMIFITLISVIADQLSNVLVIKRYGGSKLSILASVLGAFIGLFVLPPFGVVIVPFIFVFVIELLANRSSYEAMRTALGTIVAFVGGIFAKGLMQLTMIAIFLLDALR